MNWYKTATRFEPAPQMKIDPIPDAQKFFNWVKAKGITVSAFHGTSAEAWTDAQKSGFLLSAHALNIRPYDQKDQEQENTSFPFQNEYARHIATSVFLTFDLPYATFYAKRASANQAVVLTVSVPLYSILEFQRAVFRNVHNKDIAVNESYSDHAINDIRQQSNYQERLDLIINEIQKAKEISCQHAIPTQWVRNVSIVRAK